MILTCFADPKIKHSFNGSTPKIYGFLISGFIILKNLVFIFGRKNYTLVQAYYFVMLASMLTLFLST